ncbi:MAG: ATP-binding protein [Balneolaceae bacterium]
MMPQTYSLTLKSKFQEAEKVPNFIDKIDSELNLDEDLKNRMMLALSEAATNAIVHGNKEDIDKQVFIDVQIDDDSVTIKIKDQGKGFDPADVPSPVEDENLLNPGGRGLYLMEEFADKVVYNRGGTLVILRFER